MKKVLLIAYHYPPVGVSSGVHRTLKFSQYLREYGWEPIILTVHPRAYERVSDNQLKDIPSDLVVKRAFGLDTARHLAIGGRFWGRLALPDRWVSWWLGAVLSGKSMILKYKPDAIWSTYPIATAHLIGRTLHRSSSIPWVADFRDSMTDDHYPTDETKWNLYRRIERSVVHTATKVVFTTPGTQKMYFERYPDVPADRWSTIENGFDEESFSATEDYASLQHASLQKEAPGRVTLVHSGLLYPSERDPTQFFRALSELKTEGIIDNTRLSIVLRASGHENIFQPMLGRYAIDDLVQLASPLPYSDALNEMVSADGLLLFQASNCNHQIPAKIYEYFRAKRPIFALTDPRGETARVMMDSGLDTLVPLDSSSEIKAGLIDFLQRLKNDTAPLATEEVIRSHSRRARTEQLAQLLDTVVGKC
ncbi:MAG: glycosyltransferase [Gammaproteobacteria bacterium]|nr:glycosyltransferase [Pseudomonadales bacterium]